MDRSRHLRIGMAAHSLGLLDLERYSEALLALGALGDPMPDETFWSTSGRMSPGELARVLDVVDHAPADRPTMRYADGAPPEVLEGLRADQTPLPVDPASRAALTRVVAISDEQAQALVEGDNVAKTMAHGVMGSGGHPATVARAPSLSFNDLPAPTPPLAMLPPLPEATRYRVERMLGAGGMGEVFECIDTVLGRRVALKRLRPEGLDDSLAISMLEREARVVGSLEHPNIIPIYDAGYLDTSGPFYAMRIVERPSLEVLLRKLRDGDEAAVAEFSLGRLLRAFIQVCGAVDYAHSRGVIHCDLKPANILLGSFGEVLVVDWGMAHSPEESAAYQGGTPGYMAPEQLQGKPPDARTDVYALGAILYEVLTLRPAFADRAPGGPGGLMSPDRRPVPPQTRAPDRTIPDELAEASLKALEVDPTQRFPSASAFGAAIETFLEGTRDRERRELRAAELVARGDSLASSYEEMLAERPERVDAISELLQQIPPWETAEQKQSLWNAEDSHLYFESLTLRTLQSAVSEYEHALVEVPGFAPARRGLARLYRGEISRAYARRDDRDRIHFENELAQVDDENAGAAAGASLQITTLPEGVHASLHRIQEIGRRLVVVHEEDLGTTPATVAHLAPGSYALRLTRPGFIDITAPVMMRSGHDQVQQIDLRGSSDLKPGEVFIPGGIALLGGDETNLHGQELREIDVPSFFMATFPVSFHEYLEFLMALLATDPAAAASHHVPRDSGGSPLWIWTGSLFEPARALLGWSGDPEHLLALPAFGVDIASAQAYARWKSESTGRTYRLPTEDEWEKAARGVDGRRFPWGDRFDASFCKMRESRSDLPVPEPCGVFPEDISPYGVRDMAGSIAEWVVPPGLAPGEPLPRLASRGGAWCDWRGDCLASTRRPYFLGERSARVGFRVVREVRSQPSLI